MKTTASPGGGLTLCQEPPCPKKPGQGTHAASTPATHNGYKWPLLARPVPAGFPSPADDYTAGRISLDEHLVEHKEATFFLRVEGDSMQELGILDGGLLVVDRALTPTHSDVIIAVLEGEFTVKQLSYTGGRCVLRAANPVYRDIVVGHEEELVVWGVVRWAIHKVWPAS